jgi:hypothetical protein
MVEILKWILMENELNKSKKKVGRKPKTVKAKHKYMFRLTAEENAKFFALYDQSRISNRAEFVRKTIFEKDIKIIYYNKSVYDFYMKLTHFYSQFRAVGTNYNQVVKILYRHFSERKVAAYLYKLEKQTRELAKLTKEITDKIQSLEGKHISKEVISANQNQQKGQQR